MSRSVNIPQAVTMGAATLAWYALPDVVRSRPARALLKTGLITGGGAAWVAFRDRRESGPGPDVYDEIIASVNEAPGATLGFAALGLGIGGVLTVVGEKAIFRFGERRRARGVRFAHAAPAAALGILGALSTLPLGEDDPVA